MNHRSIPLVTLAAAAALAVLVPAPALARDVPYPWEVHREVRGHVHDVLRELVRVPERIHSRHRAHLEIFLGGRNYYAPHRHYHSSYRFPVMVGGSVAYRPYDYCEDRYFGAPNVRFELWRDWGRDRHSHWCGDCGGYYPTGHRHGRGDRHDRYDRYDRYDRHDRYDRYDRSPHYNDPVYRGGHRYDRHDRYDRRDRRDRYDRDRYRHGDRRHRCDRHCDSYRHH